MATDRDVMGRDDGAGMSAMGRQQVPRPAVGTRLAGAGRPLDPPSKKPKRIRFSFFFFPPSFLKDCHRF